MGSATPNFCKKMGSTTKKGSDTGASLREGEGALGHAPPSDVSQTISYRPNYGNFYLFLTCQVLRADY